MTKDESNMSQSREALYKEVGGFALAGLHGEAYQQGREHVQFLVDDWLAQAARHGADVKDVVAAGRDDLRQLLDGLDPQERYVRLGQRVLEWHVQHLSSRSLELATGFVKGREVGDAAKQEALKINQERAALFTGCQEISDPSLKRRLLRTLADVGLECDYILDDGEGAMSIRLNRYTS